MTDIKLSNSLRRIPTETFHRCTSLTSIIIPSNATSIGQSAFKGCTKLANVSIPASVTSIENNAFTGCKGLTSITIPTSVTTIGYSAFEQCTKLTSATVLNPNVTIGTDVFYSCPSSLVLRGWDPSTAKTYAEENSIAFESLGTVAGSCGSNVTYDFDPATGTLTISGTGQMTAYNSSDRLPWYNYRNCIFSVNIGGGVTSIGRLAFYDCDSLTGVTIPDSVRSIGASAFNGCAGLTSITIPNGLTHIYDNAFTRCAGLTSVVIPNSMTYIGSYVFSDCSNLTNATILNPNVTIGKIIFYNCSSSMVLRGWPGSTAEAYAQAAGHSFEALPLMVLPYALTTIEEDAFQGISALGVRIPAGVSTISGNPFTDSNVQYILGVSGTAAQTLADTYGYIFIPVTD